MIHYLDNAATSRVLPAAAEAAVHMMREEFGNPSSLHKMGIEAARVLKDSREAVAAVLGGTPAETYFTSGGTESINTAIFGAARKNRHAGRHIVT
ncbi:MAG: aminotransferase class V-fold PLP-dependent enzyme, partial [Butyricicoccus pullicaecorum]